jgi:hypothetical protein
MVDADSDAAGDDETISIVTSALTVAGNADKLNCSTFDPLRITLGHRHPAVMLGESVGTLADTSTVSFNKEALHRKRIRATASEMYGRLSSTASTRFTYSTGIPFSAHPTLLATLSSPSPGASTAGGVSQRTTDQQHDLFSTGV